MARRAGVTPFTLANTNTTSQQQPNHSLSMARQYSQLPPSMMPSSHPHQHFRRNSNPSASLSHPLSHSLSQPGSQPPGHSSQQLPSLAELTAGLPAFAPHHHHTNSNPANSIEAHSPYHEYPHRRSLPPGGLPSGTAFDHLPPPGSLAGYPRPGSPAAGGTPLGGPPNSYFPTSAPTAREINGRR
jgi:hypothetical protein